MKFCPHCRSLYLNDAKLCKVCVRVLERITFPYTSQVRDLLQEENENKK